MATYLLIHGAWTGGWCWRKLVPLLEAQGHKVLTPDLPGHGADKTPAPTVTLKAYVDRVCQTASAQKEGVILVGHSMSGVVITQAAENCPEQVRALVYLCAVLPRSGDSFVTWAQKDPASLVIANVLPLENGLLGVKPEVLHDALFENCSEEDECFARSHLVPQAAAPFHVPIVTTPDHWGRIPRYYVECLSDRAVTLNLQREMQKYSPCEKTFSIDTDHSPYFSTPERLADILSDIANLEGHRSGHGTSPYSGGQARLV